MIKRNGEIKMARATDLEKENLEAHVDSSSKVQCIRKSFQAPRKSRTYPYRHTARQQVND